MKDLATLLSVVAIAACIVIGMALYNHTSNASLHRDCPCLDGKCPCDDSRPEPRKPAPFRPRRPDGSTGETGKIDGVTVRDM